MKTNIGKKYICLIAILIISLLISIILFLCKDKGTKRSMIFPSSEGSGYVLETRYLKKIEGKDDISVFISELLLGSTVERTKLLFTPGTKLINCFLRNGELYVNLSEDLIDGGDNVVSIESGIELLDMNIKKNFKEVKNVQCYINGNLAFEETKALTK